MADPKGGLNSIENQTDDSSETSSDVSAPSNTTMQIGGMKVPVRTAISSEVLKSLQDEITRRQNDRMGGFNQALAQAGAFSTNRPDLAANIQQQQQQEQQNIFNMKAQLAAAKAAQLQQAQALQGTNYLMAGNAPQMPAGNAPQMPAGNAPAPAGNAPQMPSASPQTGNPIPPNVTKLMQGYMLQGDTTSANKVFQTWALEDAKQTTIARNRPENDLPQTYFINNAQHVMTPNQFRSLNTVTLPNGDVVTPDQVSGAQSNAAAPTAAPTAAAPTGMPTGAPAAAAPTITPATAIAGGPLPPGFPLPAGPLPSLAQNLPTKPGVAAPAAAPAAAPVAAPAAAPIAASPPDFENQVRQRVTDYARSLPRSRNPEEAKANIERVKEFEKGLRELEQKRLQSINETEQKRIQDLNAATSKSVEKSSEAAGVSAGKIFDLADRAPDVIAKADFIINHATNRPNEFGWSYKDTSKSALAPVLSAMTAIPGHLVEPAAERLAANFAGPGVAERRSATDRAATQLAMDQAAQMFVGSGARLGVGLEQMVQNSKGVGTENPAFVNIVNANFIKLGYQKAQAIAAAMNDHPELNKNQLMQSEIGRRINSEFNTKLDAMENDLKKVYPDVFNKTTPGNRPPIESFRRKQ